MLDQVIFTRTLVPATAGGHWQIAQVRRNALHNVCYIQVTTHRQAPVVLHTGLHPRDQAGMVAHVAAL